MTRLPRRVNGSHPRRRVRPHLSSKRGHRKMVWDEDFQRAHDERKAADHLNLYLHLTHKQRRDMLICTLLLWGSLERVQKHSGGDVVISDDVLEFLERSAQVMIHRGIADEMTKRILLMRCTEDGHRLARETGAEDARGVALATAYLIMQLVDSGMWADPDSQAVYVSLGILDEAERDGKSNTFEKHYWPWDEVWLPRAAFRMAELGRLCGYF